MRFKFLVTIYFLFLVVSLHSRNTSFPGDTIEIRLNNFKTGDIQWQSSPDNNLWTNIEGAKTPILFSKQSQTTYYRVLVTNCNITKKSSSFLIETNQLCIRDKNANIIVQWKSAIDTSTFNNFKLTIEGLDESFIILKKDSSFIIPRKKIYYNRNFKLEAIDSTNSTIFSLNEIYQNDLTRFFNSRFKFIAHRGFSSEYPENTLIAYEKAAELGFEYVECDIVLTKDHQWVLSHDLSIDRCSNKKGLISDYTLSELREFNFGFPDMFGSKFNVKIPTLREYVELCDSLNLKPLIELKQDASMNDFISLMKSINEILPHDRYEIHCFSYPILQKVKKIDPKVIVGLLANSYDSNHSDYLNNLYPCSYNTYSNNIIENSNEDTLLKKGIFLCFWAPVSYKDYWTIINKDILIITGFFPGAQYSK
jgi:glycerophosphoryl diester phosphodiesterase